MMRWPAGVAVSPRSLRICMTIAVDDSTKPMPATKATGRGEAGQACPTMVSSAPQTNTCAAPSPKISRRRLHSRDGCISRPMTNRNITTPSSATCRIACGSVNRPRPNGPIDQAGRRDSRAPSPGRAA